MDQIGGQIRYHENRFGSLLGQKICRVRSQIRRHISTAASPACPSTRTAATRADTTHPSRSAKSEPAYPRSAITNQAISALGYAKEIQATATLPPQSAIETQSAPNQTIPPPPLTAEQQQAPKAGDLEDPADRLSCATGEANQAGPDRNRQRSKPPSQPPLSLPLSPAMPNPAELSAISAPSLPVSLTTQKHPPSPPALAASPAPQQSQAPVKPQLHQPTHQEEKHNQPSIQAALDSLLASLRALGSPPPPSPSPIPPHPPLAKEIYGHPHHPSAGWFPQVLLGL